MATCGSCKQEGQTVEHIRACYTQNRGVVLAERPVVQPVREQRDYRPMALNIDVPASHYAIETQEGLKFYEVRIGKPGTKWDGFRFVDRLIGHPGSWKEIPVKGASRLEVLRYLAPNPMEAAVRYSREFTVCACCGSPLSDPESMARGLGPVCAERF